MANRMSALSPSNDVTSFAHRCLASQRARAPQYGVAASLTIKSASSENKAPPEEVATIGPFEFTDAVAGDKIAVSVSQRYSKNTVHPLEHLFVRETREFNRVATTFRLRPTAV